MFKIKGIKAKLRLTKKKQRQIITFLEYALVLTIIICFVLVFVSRGSLSLR